MAKERPSWQLADLIDYEFFLDADERQPSADIHARDRELFTRDIAPALPSGVPAGEPVPRAERRAVLRRWTDARRLQLKRGSDRDETLLPGEAFAQVRGGVATALGILGLVIGWTAAAAALAYSAGAEPINAFVFFVEFALAQVLILVGAFAVLGARWWFPDVKIPSLARWCLRAAARLAVASWKRGRVRIAGARRQNAEALFGVLRARHTLYREVLVWSLVGLTQIFAIAFNAGVLGAMTARHLFHDLDFGWESTWLDGAQVSTATRTIAAPWSWLVRPGYPNAAQVAGSQNRKRDSGRLEGESLKSWSQFLFGVVIVYGLLPRLLLMALAARAQRSTLKKLAFNDGRSALTLGRLLTPTVQTYGVTPAAVLPNAGSSVPLEAAPFRPPTPAATRRDAPQGLLLLNLTGCPFDAPAAATAAGRANAAADRRPVTVFEADPADEEAEKRAYATLGDQAAAAPEAEVFALLASWVPPMIATQLSLDGLRAAVGPGRLVTLVLVGKPAPDGSFRPVRATDRELWVKAVQTRADAFLALP